MAIYNNQHTIDNRFDSDDTISSIHFSTGKYSTTITIKVNNHDSIIFTFDGTGHKHRAHKFVNMLVTAVIPINWDEEYQSTSVYRGEDVYEVATLETAPKVDPDALTLVEG